VASLIAAEIGTGPRGNAGAVVVLQVGRPSRACNNNNKQTNEQSSPNGVARQCATVRRMHRRAARARLQGLSGTGPAAGLERHRQGHDRDETHRAPSQRRNHAPARTHAHTHERARAKRMRCLARPPALNCADGRTDGAISSSHSFRAH
jgi:hypothetical protein